MKWTDFGWGIQSEAPHSRHDLLWVAPSGNIYAWDGDGWYRISPPEIMPEAKGDLPHG